MTECTEQCLKDQARYKEILADFIAKYPEFCHSCSGYGHTIYQYDPSPAGVSLSSGHMEDVEVCLKCEGSETPTCALCSELMKDNQRICECSESAGMPQEPECWCWVVGLWNGVSLSKRGTND